MTDITLDLPLPPSVNKTRRVNWAGYRGYKSWMKNADANLMMRHQNKQHSIIAPYRITIEVDYSKLQSDLDNIVKALIDYCVSRAFVPDDRKRFLKGIAVEFVDHLPDGCRVTLRPISSG
jgi:Holliday junction resolvase RusA-like endonuclease